MRKLIYGSCIPRSNGLQVYVTKQSLWKPSRCVCYQTKYIFGLIQYRFIIIQIVAFTRMLHDSAFT